MSTSTKRYAGGCLCGALRYEAEGDPIFAGYCCCADCRKSSGSGFSPFLGFASSAVRFSGRTRTFTSKSASGGDAVRNFCAACGSLVFGGIVGQSAQHSIYAGSLDEPGSFRPTMAIFNGRRPDWVILPPGLAVFEQMPTGNRPA